MKFSTGLILACAALVPLTVTTAAGPRKVLVLPVDGDADAAAKAKCDGAVQKLAKSLDGEVKVGATSFSDGAIAAGCNPELASCADTVIGMLKVDELVFGTCNTTDGTTTLTVKRQTKGSQPKDQSATFTATDPQDKAEQGLAPLFGVAPAEGSGSGSAAGSGSAEPAVPWSHDKKLGIGLAAGGGAALVIGFALWANESDLQDQINKAPIGTLAQIQSLKSLEDKAGSYALWGDILVVVGLAAGGAGAYYLWKDHKNPVVVAPTPVDQGTGAALVVGGRW
jgi:hypothetical protein